MARAAWLVALAAAALPAARAFAAGRGEDIHESRTYGEATFTGEWSHHTGDGYLKWQFDTLDDLDPRLLDFFGRIMQKQWLVPFEKAHSVVFPLTVDNDIAQTWVYRFTSQMSRHAAQLLMDICIDATSAAFGKKAVGYGIAKSTDAAKKAKQDAAMQDFVVLDHGDLPAMQDFVVLDHGDLPQADDDDGSQAGDEHDDPSEPTPFD